MKQMTELRESERKRLVELLTDDLDGADNPLMFACEVIVERLADHLLDNKVVVPSVEIGANDKTCEYAAVVPTTGVILCNWFFENVKDNGNRPFCHFPLCSKENCKLK